MAGIVKGIGAPLAGIRFLKDNPKLLRYFAVPVLINTIVYSAGGYLFFTRLPVLLHWIFGEPATWYMKAAYYAAGTVIAGVFALFLIFTFTAVGIVVAGPFLEVLSRKVDEIRFGRDPVQTEVPLLKSISLSLGGQVKKLILFLLIQGLLLLVYFIPVVGQAAGAPLQIAATFFFLAWEFWDFPMDRRGMNFQAKKDLLWRNKYQALAFGAVCGLYIMVPLLNFFMIPASVAGATLLVADLLNESGRPETVPKIQAP